MLEEYPFRHCGNRHRAAKRLGISERTLHHKIRKYGP
ncbi:MAG: hypothetical protein E3J72_02165 [Planctomycetota bacterium]|nr:MAG: hypothetical protein E3J72_02165 [Planctomycetota bacterium]